MNQYFLFRMKMDSIGTFRVRSQIGEKMMIKKSRRALMAVCPSVIDHWDHPVPWTPWSSVTSRRNLKCCLSSRHDVSNEFGIFTEVRKCTVVMEKVGKSL